jgi:predicted MFS family arabinose efflux permease
MIPEYFGRTHQGAIRGAVTPIMVVVSSLGAPIGGYLLDAGMSYTTFFWAVIIAVAIGSAAALFQLPPKRRVRTQTERIVAEQVAP